MVTTHRDYVLFTFVLRRLVATIQHLGLGELPLAQASASHLAIGLSFSLGSNQTRVGTDARGKETDVNREVTKEEESRRCCRSRCYDELCNLRRVSEATQFTKFLPTRRIAVITSLFLHDIVKSSMLDQVKIWDVKK